MSIEVVTPNGVKKVRGVEVFGSGGESHVLPPNLDIFTYVGVQPIITNANGVYFIQGELENNAVNLRFKEQQANFEGINIGIPDLTIGSTYLINFDFQFTDAHWFNIGNYRTGVTTWNNDYAAYNDYTAWPENIDRDLLKHNHQITFTATAETMYLSFNLCGCSDSYINYFEMTDFYVRETSQ